MNLRFSELRLQQKAVSFLIEAIQSGVIVTINGNQLLLQGVVASRAGEIVLSTSAEADALTTSSKLVRLCNM